MKLLDTAAQVINGVNAAKQLFTNRKKEEARQDGRQITQQGKLNEVNAKTAKELADYEQGLKLQMWKDTNYSAQLGEAQKAGLSKVAVLGGSGGGTQGASVGSGGIGGGAASAAATEMAKVQSELAKAQAGNLLANTAKTVAETKKIEGVDTELTGAKANTEKFNLEMQKILKENNIIISGNQKDMSQITMEQANASWEAVRTAISGTSLEDKNNPLVKQKAAEMQQTLVQLDNLIKEGVNKQDQHELAEIEKQIAGFSADLTDLGINGTTAGAVTSIIGKLLGIRVNTGGKQGAKPAAKTEGGKK